MSHAMLSGSAQPTVSPGRKSFVAAVLAAWLALILVLGGAHAFVTPPGTPPFPIAIAVITPIVLFLAAFWLSGRFRDFVLAADLRLMLGIQAWRFAGLAFLALYTYEVLPASFAWPAGLGDMAIGATAPWLIVALIRQPRFAASKTFVVWNLLGLLDLIVAVCTGALNSALATGAPGETPMTPMAQLPLVLISAYLVPIFFMLHLAALIQARRLR
jgi:uncharacterized membrane protein YedE/YeeE